VALKLCLDWLSSASAGGHAETFPGAKSPRIVGAAASQPVIFRFTVPFFAKSSIAAQLS
jgi:hypothetical protein